MTKPKPEDREAALEKAGNAEPKGGKPGDRERGETGSAEEGTCLDMDAAHDRAS